MMSQDQDRAEEFIGRLGKPASRKPHEIGHGHPLGQRRNAHEINPRKRRGISGPKEINESLGGIPTEMSETY